MNRFDGLDSTVLVTGGTGFFGLRLLEVLRHRGRRVRALVRPSSDVRRLQAIGVEVVRGDVTEPESLALAFEGQSTVIHTVSKVSDWGPRQEFFRINAQGTMNVVAACRVAGVQRLVHLGSLTVLGLPRCGMVVDEATPTAVDPRDAYTASKLSAETTVRAAHVAGGLETVVVRSGVIWGPGEATILPRIVDLMRRGRMIYPGGGGNHLGMTFVDNLVAGVLLAASASDPGRVYHITDGEDVTSRELLDALAGQLGLPPPRRSVPFPAIYAAATLMEWAFRLLGRANPPPITRYGVRLMACDSRYDITRARREIGYRPVVSFLEGIALLGKAWKAAP